MYRYYMQIAFCVLFGAITVAPLQAGIEVKTVQKLTTDSAPIDISISADGKRVFILTVDGKIEVMGNDGSVLGQIKVPTTVDGIEASPDGSVLFVQDSVDKSVQIMTINLVYDINTVSSPILGNKEAPITLAVFSDFQ